MRKRLPKRGGQDTPCKCNQCKYRPHLSDLQKNDEITRIINDFADKNRPVYNFEAAGALQTVWVIDDDEINSRLSELFGSVKAFYIADGHHRCESAVRVGQMKDMKTAVIRG